MATASRSIRSSSFHRSFERVDGKSPEPMAKNRIALWSAGPEWIRDYRKEWMKRDVIAGLTAAGVVIPKAMAYATIAGLPVQVGLYTAFLPMGVYAVVGTSRPLSVSTTTTLAILTAAALGQAGAGGDLGALSRASATLALLVGLFLVGAGASRLGRVSTFLS